MYKGITKKTVLFVAILVIATQLIFTLAQNAGFSLAQSTECLLTVSISPNTPAAQSVSPGQTGVSLVKFNLSSNCDITLNSFAVSLLPMPNGYLNISSLRLYNGATQVSSAMNVTGASVNFTGLSTAISANQTIAFDVKGDINISAIASSTVYGVFGGSSATGSSGSVGNNASGNIIAGNTMTINSSGSGGGSGSSSVPAAPTGLMLDGTPTSTSISLRWTNNSTSADHFNIERKVTTTTAYTSVQLTGSDITSYLDNNIIPGTTYDYRVQACKSGYGCSGYADLFGVSSASGSSGTSCTGLNLTLNDGKTTYTIGDSVNYTWTCSPGGSASMVYIWLYKPNGTSFNYNYGSGSTQSMGFSTSNLLPGTHILKACFDSACTTVIASQTFMMVSGTTVSTSTPTPTPTSTSGSGSGSGSSITTPILNAWIDSVYVSSATSSPTVISGIKSAGATSPNTSFPNLTFYIKNTANSTDYASSVLSNLSYPESGSQGMNWSGTLNTASLPSGSYYFYAKGYPNGITTGTEVLSNFVNFAINNSNTTSTPVPIATAVPYLSAWIETISSSSTLAYPMFISGIKNSNVNANYPFSNLTFYLYKITSTDSVTDWTNYYTSILGNTAPVSGSQITSWKGTIDAAKLSNGNYKFFAKGSYNGTEYMSNYVYFAIDNSTTLASTPVPPTVIPTIKVGINSPSAGYTIGGMQTVWADSSAPLTSLSFKFYNTATNILSSYIIIGYPSTTTAPDAFGNYNYWLGSLDTFKLGNGSYKLIAKGIYNNSAYENTTGFNFNVNNSTTSTTVAPSPVPMFSPIPPKTSSPFPTPFNSYPAVTNLPSSPVPYVDLVSRFPQECREKNIFDPEQCKQLMSQLGMPNECLVAGAKTQEECSKVIILQSLPPECREANAISEEDCNKVMFVKYGPKECIEANIFNKDDCEKFIFKKNAPPECLSQGISAPQDCEKYMVEKYGNLNNIKPNDLPVDCQKAGASSTAECDKIMKDKYMPTDCKAQGITDAGQCDFYLSTKNMPSECRAAGVKTKEECNKVMFKKFSPEPCKKAGIENEKECKNFMFNLYAPRVVCDSLNSWDCKREIQENHLGNIVAKQEGYKKIKEDISSLSGTSASIEKIKEKVGQENKMIPLTENAVVLKIANADEKVVLNGEENLVQTAPIVVMIDSDGDGLPDDTEKRIGTDSNNRDTDNDGLTDSEEIKNGYDPLGAGEMTEKAKGDVSPIDWALIQDKTLGHPTVDGSESKELVVSTFVNIKKDKTDSQSAGYELTGKGEKNSVVTIYIYSDMPVVATVKTDEFGNWKYELDKSLVDGEHEVYVAVNDNTGKVVNKSQPLRFFINEAKAVSVTDFIKSQNIIAPKESEKAISSYAIIALLAIIAGIIVFVFAIIKRKKQQAI